MSRAFVAASSDKLALGSAVLTSLPITMACWVYPAGIATRYTAMSLANASQNNAFICLDLAGDVAGDPFRARHRSDAAVDGAADSTAGFTANAWHHLCGVFSSGTSRRAILDGGNAATNTTSVGTTTVNRTGIGYRARQSLDQYMGGRIAEAAIWNVALDDAEAAALAAGVSPLLIRPSALVGYWPILGQFSPEIERMNRYEMTVTGTTAADHPPMFYRRRGPRTIFVPAGGSTFTAAGACTAGPATCSGSATFTKPTYTGAAAVTISQTTAAGSATFTKPTYTGTAAASAGPATCAGVATFTAPTYTAAAAVTIGATIAAGSAIFANAVFQATAAVTIGQTTAAGSATFTKPTYTGAAAVSAAPAVAAGSAIFSSSISIGAAAVSVAAAQGAGVATFVVSAGVSGPGVPVDLPEFCYAVDLPENLSRVDLVYP